MASERRSALGHNFAIAGTEHGPYSLDEAREVVRLQETIGDQMNQLLAGFGVSPNQRYFGEFPYPDQKSGAAKLSEVIGLTREQQRDTIAAVLRQALDLVHVPDVAVETYDRAEDSPGYHHGFSLTAMGPTVTSTLEAYRRMDTAMAVIANYLAQAAPGLPFYGHSS